MRLKDPADHNRRQHTQPGIARLLRHQKASGRAHQHATLHAQVDHPGALADHFAQRGIEHRCPSLNGAGEDADDKCEQSASLCAKRRGM